MCIVTATVHLVGLLASVVDEERMRPGHWLGVSASCFLQCFDTVGWVTGRTSAPPYPLQDFKALYKCCIIIIIIIIIIINYFTLGKYNPEE